MVVCFSSSVVVVVLVVSSSPLYFFSIRLILIRNDDGRSDDHLRLKIVEYTNPHVVLQASPGAAPLPGAPMSKKGHAAAATVAPKRRAPGGAGRTSNSVHELFDPSNS